METQQLETPTTDHPWYKNTMILFELASQCQYKYLSMMRYLPSGKTVLIRYMLGYNPQLILRSVDKFGGFKPETKLYFDLAHWKETPMFSFDADQREIQKNQFDKDCEDLVVGYDYAIDIDAKDKNPLTAWKDAKVIKDFFDKCKIPYMVKFSGSKGFHFLIPYAYLPAKYKITKLPAACGNTTRWLMNRFNLKSVAEGGNMDDSIYDMRRVLKLAYSLCGPYVCLPLTDNQFENFTLERMRWETVLKLDKLYKRGLLIRTHGLTEAELKKNVAELFKGGLKLYG